MYIRIATISVKQGMLDELSAEMIRNFEAAIGRGQRPAGFLGHQFMIDRALNKVAIVSRWATEADELADRQENPPKQEARLAGYLSGKQTIEAYEVRHEL